MSQSKSKASDPPDDADVIVGDGAFREAQDDPHRLAWYFLRFRSLKGGWSLHYHRDEWFEWDGCRYRQLPASELRADVTNVVKASLDQYARRLPRKDDNNKHTTAKVTRSVVANVLQALQGL